MASNREQPAMKPADSTMEPISTPMKRVVPPAVSIGWYTNWTNGPTHAATAEMKITSLRLMPSWS